MTYDNRGRRIEPSTVPLGGLAGLVLTIGLALNERIYTKLCDLLKILLCVSDNSRDEGRSSDGEKAGVTALALPGVEVGAGAMEPALFGAVTLSILAARLSVSLDCMELESARCRAVSTYGTSRFISNGLAVSV